MVILWGAKFLAAPFLRMFFLKCFVDVFFEMLSGGFLKCFAAGVPRLASPILFAPAGVTENKES